LEAGIKDGVEVFPTPNGGESAGLVNEAFPKGCVVLSDLLPNNGIAAFVVGSEGNFPDSGLVPDDELDPTELLSELNISSQEL